MFPMLAQRLSCDVADEEEDYTLGSLYNPEDHGGEPLSDFGVLLRVAILWTLAWLSALLVMRGGEWLQHASFDSELAFVKAFGRVHEQHYQKDYPIGRLLRREPFRWAGVDNVKAALTILALFAAWTAFPPTYALLYSAEYLALMLGDLYVHQQYHVRGCYWERFRWFMRWRYLHFSKTHGRSVPVVTYTMAKEAKVAKKLKKAAGLRVLGKLSPSHAWRGLAFSSQRMTRSTSCSVLAPPLLTGDAAGTQGPLTRSASVSRSVSRSPNPGPRIRSNPRR